MAPVTAGRSAGLIAGGGGAVVRGEEELGGRSPTALTAPVSRVSHCPPWRRSTWRPICPPPSAGPRHPIELAEMPWSQ